MSAVGSRLHLRLFLEGCEVPVVAATINSQKNAAAVASIQIPANDYALDLLPRTLVHLFCFDGYRGAPPEQQVWVGGNNVRGKALKDPAKETVLPAEQAPVRTTAATQIDLENENYKLIFGGEVVGVQYTKAPSNRAIVLQCVDWSSYWDIAFQYQVSGMSLGYGNINQVFTGASATVFNEFLEGSGDIVLKLLETPPRSYPHLKGSLLSGLIHIIEAIGGCYYGKRAVKGTNDFFSVAEMRLHLTQMVGANPLSANDEKKLLHAHGFGSLFGRTLSGLGQLVTIRQVLLALQRFIFHEIVPITAPRYVDPLANPESMAAEAAPLGHDPATRQLAATARDLKQHVLELQTKQDSVESLSAGGNQRDLQKLASQAEQASRQAKVAAVRLGAGGGLNQVAAGFETVARQLGDFLSLTRSRGSTYYVFRSLTTREGRRCQQLLRSVTAGLDRILRAKVITKTSTTNQGDNPPRLLTQIYRPDVWMVAPPRCNVLFPELYSQFSFGRNFLSEVSRMLLRTHSAFFGSDFFFDGFYIAPSRIVGTRSGKSIGRGRTGHPDPDASDAPAWILRELMEHELFTGIIPVFERMSDLNLHALRGASTQDVVEGAKVGYAQLACNHIFYAFRYKARELMVAGKFNPYVVLGFPCAIIDRYIAEDQLRGAYDPQVAVRLANEFANLPVSDQQNVIEVNAAKVNQLAVELMVEREATHYLGTPEMISHSISASSGGNTQIQMGYARTTNERSEMLGDNIGRSDQAKRTRDVRLKNVVAALEPPQLKGVGILGGEIVEVRCVTDRYWRAQPAKAKAGAGAKRFGGKALLPLYVPERGFTARKRLGTRVPVGVEIPAAEYGPEVMALAGSGGYSIAADKNGDVWVKFEAFEIVERVGSYTTKDVALPAEKLVFPPWYGRSYRSEEIGGHYSHFFGIGAVTDPTVVLGAAEPITFGTGTGENIEERTLYLDDLGPILGPTNLPPTGMSQVQEAPGGGLVGPPSPNGKKGVILAEVSARSPIKDALDQVVRAYSATRTNQYDTPAFVHNYTWRPIATMVDLFGTSDLQITETGEVLAGREGFHSRAYGMVDDLRQLVNRTDGVPDRILGLEAKPHEVRGDKEDPNRQIAGRLDTRREKQTAVFRYLAALSASRGVLLG